MKLIKKRTIYDTDKAELICEWEKEVADDYPSAMERLYRTKKGNWFFSKYNRGGTVIVVPEHEGIVMDALEQHAEYEKLLQYFPENIIEA